MANQYEKKITWSIKNFSSLPSEKIYSDNFVVGDSKWRLYAYPKGTGDGLNKSLSLFLQVADSESFPYGWKRHIKLRLTVVNQISEKLSKRLVTPPYWFDQKSRYWGSPAMLPLTELLDLNGGFLVNGEVKIVAEVGVLCWQIRCVESVNNLFEKHPDIASNFRLENPHLRTTYLNSLLCLTEILSQSTEKISIVDLANAHSTLSYLTKAGFKLDWLEKKLKELGKARMQQLEQNLKDLKELKQEF
ncbi:putative MATH/TRAF domain-containing protein [Arabidopsis thaliana]